MYSISGYEPIVAFYVNLLGNNKRKTRNIPVVLVKVTNLHPT